MRSKPEQAIPRRKHEKYLNKKEQTITEQGEKQIESRIERTVTGIKITR